MMARNPVTRASTKRSMHGVKHVTQSELHRRLRWIKSSALSCAPAEMTKATSRVETAAPHLRQLTGLRDLRVRFMTLRRQQPPA